ncbi:nuclear envelope integral membrane protein 1 isoform X2 [Agrilus planipennis]|nr:nuclear envelope integral membrane protein 1 isoform X2 [Agrilus planipennis]
MQQAQYIEHVPGKNKDDFQIYCYKGRPKSIVYIWQSISLQIHSPSNNFVYYEGKSPEEVKKEYLDHHSRWMLNFFTWKQKAFKLDPFGVSCIGISSSEFYSIHLNVIRVDYWKILSLITGVILFLWADRLSVNPIFYYLCGISFGICASFLILIYFFSKLFPKKPMVYGVAVCGWTVGVYFAQLVWENMQIILLNYQMYVAWYILGTGLISFIVCYRWGPVTNQRTKNLIRWTLQGVGLLAVFFSSHFQEAAMGQVIILLTLHNFPDKWIKMTKTYWKRKFPPKVRLLTNDEYYQQGVRETTKALEDLRKYCSSPECNQWKTALKLKDVKRFASFIEGDSHISDDEILEYETAIQSTDLTDEEDMFTDDEELTD